MVQSAQNQTILTLHSPFSGGYTMIHYKTVHVRKRYMLHNWYVLQNSTCLRVHVTKQYSYKTVRVTKRYVRKRYMFLNGKFIERACPVVFV
jgi:hypothetical protein